MSSTLLESPVSVSTAAPAAVAPVSAVRRNLPRGLLFFLSHQDTYRRPIFSRQEIFCGPDTDARTAGGRVFALRTPVGSFDAADILRQLPPEQAPEFVLVKADATGRNFPRNLAALRCPKILLVGDTHHMAQPLSKVIAYAKSEPFDFVIFDHTRHHAHFFAEAGVPNLHWLPALDYGYNHRDIAQTHSRPLTFVGQVGRHHPWRGAVLDQVKDAGLPLEILRGTLAETADIYADSQVTLNVSLNGDLNLRVFESLSAGGFLLTDELSAASGLRTLFEPGKHLDTWRSPGELVEKIRFYLDHPAEAQRIRREGQAEIKRAHHPEVKQREFFDLVFSGKVNPRYDLAIASRTTVAGMSISDTTARRIEAYEAIQSLHQGAREVTIFCSDPAALADLDDLPRLRFAPLAELATPSSAGATDAVGTVEQLVWWDAPTVGLSEHLGRLQGKYIVVPDASEAVSEELATWGFAPSSAGSWVNVLVEPLHFLRRTWEQGQRDVVHARIPTLLAASHDSAETLSLANYADELGDQRLHRAALEQAISLDRNNQVALLSLAGVTLEAGEGASTLLLLEEAARIAALPPEVEELRASLSAQAADEEFVQSYYRALSRKVTPANPARKVLLVTNLFPPQELGGYGRMMWEFANGLRARGHEVRVLAGNSPMLGKETTAEERALESCVSRRLELMGVWYDGKPSPITNPKQLAERTRANARLIRNTARAMGAEVVLVGNMDFLGTGPIDAALESGLPVIHALANAAPGYEPHEQPVSPRYFVAPCSNWNGDAFQKAGYSAAKVDTLYPGARLDNFFRLFLPDTRRLRICYASLVLPYKGAHTLVDALVRLNAHGVDFTAEIAGDAPDPTYLEDLQRVVREAGLEKRVKFTGFLDRAGMTALFARSNVLVFPSMFDEPFGISQVEAMAAGLVVISSGTGGACEIVRDGMDGLRFPVGKSVPLAENLRALAAQPEVFAKLQQAAQTRAAEFSVDRAVMRIEYLIDEVMKTGEQPNL